MKLYGWMAAAFLAPNKDHVYQTQSKRSISSNMIPPPIQQVSTMEQRTIATVDITKAIKQSHNPSFVLNDGIQSWSSSMTMAAADAAPPSQKEIKLLQSAFSAFYGLERDLTAAESLLSQTLDAWQRQAPDERAGLYRVRGDCYMAMMRPADAVTDYTTAINLIEGPGGELADPTELPTAYMGRARAARSQPKQSKEQLLQASKDYENSLRLSSREDWDEDYEKIEDGATRNPYAAWEWGSTLRQAGDLEGAVKVHQLAATAFDEIGDKVRSIISSFDAGIDLAAAGKKAETQDVIETTIKRMKTVEGGDVKLLQSLLAKEGEARVALASVLWDAGEKQEAETKYGSACLRLDQLSEDAQARLSKKGIIEPERLKFSIDDGPGPFEISCTRFKNEAFLTDKLQWPESLQKKVSKLEKLAS